MVGAMPDQYVHCSTVGDKNCFCKNTILADVIPILVEINFNTEFRVLKTSSVYNNACQCFSYYCFQEYLERERQMAIQRMSEKQAELQMKQEQLKQMTQMRQMQQYANPYPQVFNGFIAFLKLCKAL